MPAHAVLATSDLRDQKQGSLAASQSVNLKDENTEDRHVDKQPQVKQPFHAPQMGKEKVQSEIAQNRTIMCDTKAQAQLDVAIAHKQSDYGKEAWHFMQHAILQCGAQ